MRFLVDECLSPTMAAAPTDAGHDAEHATPLGLAGLPDEAVLAAARSDGGMVVSADTDFGELLAGTNAPTPSIILFRGAEVAPTDLAARSS